MHGVGGGAAGGAGGGAEEAVLTRYYTEVKEFTQAPELKSQLVW